MTVSPESFLLAQLAASMHVDPEVVNRRGVTVAADPSRSESHVSAGYLLGQHLVITCDPAAQALLVEATASMEPTLDAWRACGLAAGGEHLGEARMQLLAAPLPTLQVPHGYVVRRLDRTVAGDVALVEQLVEVSSEDDIDEIELDLADLNEQMLAVLDEQGKIAAFSEYCPFDLAPDFGDLGVLTRSDCRGKGLGKVAVAAITQDLLDSGGRPLYRCDEDNVGSIRLSAALGFAPVTKLVAYRFTAT